MNKQSDPQEQCLQNTTQKVQFKMTENKDQYQVDISDQYQALKEIMVQQQQLIKILNDKLSSIIQTSPKIK